MASAQVDFKITLSMRVDNSTGLLASETNVTQSEELYLSPAEPHILSPDKTVEAELLGDFAGYQELPSMR